MTSETEFSGCVSAFSRVRGRVAYTGGVILGACGSFSLSYSVLAVVAEVLEVMATFVRATCKGTRAWSSDEVDPINESIKNEPLRGYFLEVRRFLSISNDTKVLVV